ncbi:endonuclease/exonuclease/phosphatase family protein [Orenia marismortui]|uniref:endonuclease/exonuclease/phosphatase family protein n=1 Tax=Orenia marismortui TaxID=46469 RepID=UPI0003812815|nr:endonuclease/exonuclease/phosphatase family protein [Orenia marismortui]
MIRRLKKRKLIILATLVISLLTVLGCSNNDDNLIKENTYSVSGTIKDLNGNGIQGVSISYGNASISVESDATGNWELDNLNGEQKLVTAAEDYTILPSSHKVAGEESNINFIALTPIADLRNEEGKMEDIGGIVSAVLGNNIYIQDNTAGILVYGIEYPELTRGSEIIVTGEISQYYGMAEIKPDSIDDITLVKAEGRLIVPEVITANDLSVENGEAYEGKLVTIKNITIEDNNSTKNLDATDSTGTAVVRLEDDKLSIDKGKSYTSITGVVKYHYGEYKIIPRSQADIVADGDNSQGNIPEGAVALEIYQIQGASHDSPQLNNPVKEVDGIVTAKDKTGFYMQEIDTDDNDATSEAIYILSDKAVTVGDKVIVAGNVEEYAIPHTEDEWWIDIPRQLTITAIEATQVQIKSTGNDLPSPIILGVDRTIPEHEIDNDNLTSFDITEDAIDFYESLEGMRVQIDNALVVGPTEYGQIAVLSCGGSNNSGARTEYGGVLIAEDDFNPERIIVETDTLEQMDLDGDGYADSFDVGDKFNQPFVGIIGYDEGKYMLYNTKEFSSESAFTRANNNKDITTINYAEDKLTIASFNVKNLSAAEASRMSEIASAIVNNLKNPDIVGLVEIQDNNGEDNNGVVAADKTYNKLISAISNAGGVSYGYVNIDPIDGQDGGAPGGNIRVGFIYRKDRINFTAKGNATATDAVSIQGSGESITLSLNPGRIYPSNGAFDNSRKPLVAEFEFNGEKIFVVANHFNSKGGDAPLFGKQQPPVFSSETQRKAQAEVVNGFVQEVLSANPNANLVVLGDMNDFEFSDAVNILEGSELTNLVKNLEDDDRFTYIYEGNSQILDHILVSNNLAATTEIDAVHINSIYAEYGPIGIVSDHDPIMVQISNFGN